MKNLDDVKFDKEMIDKLVDKFLRWPLPQSVCSDQCAAEYLYEYPRSGTNLLTAQEAAQMFEFILNGEME